MQARQYGPWIAFTRIFVGAFWLFEVTLGHNWKIGNPAWVGPGAGGSILAQGAAGVEAGTFAWFAWMLENLIYPYAAAWSYAVTGLQVALALALIFGALVRPFTLLALGMDLVIYLVGNSRIPPFFTIGHLFLFAVNAGLYHGVDGWLARRLAGVRTAGAAALRFLVNLSLLSARGRVLLGAGVALAAIYFLLNTAVVPTQKMQMVTLELGVIAGMVAFGLFYSARPQVDSLALSAGLLRIFVGYKLLHEIFVRSVPATNGLPGWGSAAQLTAVFNSIIGNHPDPASGLNHLGFVPGLLSAVFLPAAGLWVLIFAVAQTAAALMLVLGVRSRGAGYLLVGFLVLLTVLGFNRYAPFVLGYAIAVLALDGGRLFSLDTYIGREEAPLQLRVPLPAALGHLVLALLALVLTLTSGVQPDGYTATMGGMTLALVALLNALLGIAGLLQYSLHPRPGALTSSRGVART